MEAGYLSVELDELRLALNVKSEALKLRIDLSIVGGFDVFQWVSSGDANFSTTVFTPLLQEDEAPAEVEGEEAEAPAVFNYINGFNNVFIRSTFIDLNDEVMNGLANATLQVSVMSINEGVEVAKPVKGQPPVDAKPAEEALLLLCLPLHALLTAPNGSLSFFQPAADLLASKPFDARSTMHPSVVGSSVLAMKVAADNDLAEYALGAKVLQWEGATLDSLPATWALSCPDVTDPKAKVAATAEDLRAKYLENVPKLVAAQSSLATFQLSLGGTKGEPATETMEGETETDEAEPPIHSMIPSLALSVGTISWDAEKAARVPVEEDIRARGDLWAISWGSSSVVFMHRSVARRFTMLLMQSRAQAYLNLSVKKIPVAGGAEIEAGEMQGSAQISIAPLTSTGITLSLLEANLGVGFEGSKFSAAVVLSSALLPTPALEALTAMSKPILKGASDIPPGLLSATVVSSGDPNRDIMQELRAEIASTIEKIGQEYLSLYPEPVQAPFYPTTGASRETSPRAAHPQTQIERKAEFLDYLTHNGIFHDLKTNLKPKVQILIRERYGNRGRALVKSQAMGTVDLNRDDEEKHDVGGEITAASVEAVLSDLYVFLLKQCSLVLNSMFSDTLIGREAQELEKSAYINDEEETKLQISTRLLNQAGDAAANRAYGIADALHLERIQLISHTPSLGSDIDTVHTAYASYGRFLLEQAAYVLAGAGAVAADVAAAYVEKTLLLLDKAREALASAYTAKPVWDVGLLYAGLLVELEQAEQAEVVLLKVLQTQLMQSGCDLDMQSFGEFDGYESDALTPVNPKVYSVMAALFHSQGFPLRARKALLLSNRSFAEGGFLPNVSTHGSPRRTIVLTLAQTGLHLFQHGLVRLGQACVKLAVSSEAAVTAKATARGKPAATMPHIKYLLKRLQSVGALYAESAGAAGERVDQAVQLGREAQLVAEDAADQVFAWSTIALALQVSGADLPAVVDALLQVVGCSHKLDFEVVKSTKIVALEVFLQAGRLLLLGGRFNQARTVLLYGCAVYSSAGLFMLLGVCYLRLDELGDAEEALVEANLLDNRNADVWAYLSLVCLSGPHRVLEAERSLEQSLRLGLTDTQLLRELATSFMSVDKLQTAEDLIRRALRGEAALASQAGSKYTSNARTRRLLADVLAGQNQAVRAVEEYQSIIADDGADLGTKQEAAERCADLLVSLGREEELATLRSIIDSLKEGQVMA
ncbi:hypothetical protein B484DRAFT_391710 [Ochromonadaceae sp. CCMP2298]|nr:hypothetical protein B484DRAFT_391710 [Ochromonadaceae sp. CCMP2298]|mmetsp:Transcript_10536/g.23398  ORF Transcript_10536/g.23398 Transcript_10536/m.23398 type:complete len:1222 (-) Transcript_10536:899-4564(-)